MWLAKPHLIQGNFWARVLAGLVMIVGVVTSVGANLLGLAIAYAAAPNEGDLRRSATLRAD